MAPQVGFHRGEAQWCDRRPVGLASPSRWRLSAGNLQERVSLTDNVDGNAKHLQNEHRESDPRWGAGVSDICTKDIRAGRKGFHQNPSKYFVLPKSAAGIKGCFLFFPLQWG